MSAIEEIIDTNKQLEGPLLPILHEIQAAFGYVSEENIRLVADGLNLTRAEVHGVVSFYHDFRSKPAAGRVLKICRSEACQARGCEALLESVEALAGEAVTLEPVYCLGLCSVGPAALTDTGEVYARLDQGSLTTLIKGLS